MHDRYRNWPVPGYGPTRPIRGSPTVEDQVLADLAAAGSEMEKLEILDSYAAHAQRCYRVETAEVLSLEASRFLQTLLKPWFSQLLPEVYARHRTAVARAVEEVPKPQ
jgi:hypothetical protein